MKPIESLQQAIQYIENHLTADLSMEQIAKQANVSSFHFQRIFSTLTGVSVGEYIRRRRLTLAAQELLTTDKKIIDIALAYGYDTPESFSKAFRKQHHASPSELRKGHGKLQCYNRMIIQVQLKGAEPMQYKLIEKDAFQIAGVKRRYSFTENENLRKIPLFWQELNQNGTTAALAEMSTGDFDALLGVCVDYPIENQMDYWIGIPTNATPPSPFASREIPAHKWAVFEVPAGDIPSSIQETWKKIYSEWFPSNGFEHGDAPGFEAYYAAEKGEVNGKIEIWIPVI